MSSSHKPAVRRHCQTMALWIGLPVALSQTMVVSRWLVMPMAATCRGFTPSFSSTSRATPLWVPQISMGSCSTQPGRG